MPVGDINSSAVGSGARYNDGKPDLALIPVDIARDVLLRTPNVIAAEPVARVTEALFHLSRWQQTCATEHLYDALAELDDPLVNAARVFSYGAKKYATWNWCKGMMWSIPVACAMRHAKAVIDGELHDPESGETHEGHLACNLIMLIFYSKHFRAGDDITYLRILPAA